MLCVILTGCSHKDTLKYTCWLSPDAPYPPKPNSTNAFDDYARAAQETEQIAHKYLLRVHFTPGMKKKIIEDIRPCMDIIRIASQRSSDYIYRAQSAFSKRPFEKGWRLLSRALIWNIENSIYLEEYDQAITDYLCVTKFGMDLTGGDAIDLSLGLKMVDDARCVFSPCLGQLNSEQLHQVHLGLSGILSKRPDLTTTIDHEKKNMMAGVQYVQDCYCKEDYDALIKNLGKDIEPAIKFLKKLKGQNKEKSLLYFQSFAAEARNEAKLLKIAANQPTSKRTLNTHHRSAYRPWKRFARHFFGSGRTMLEIYDKSLARTKMLIIKSYLVNLNLKKEKLPNDLYSLPKEVIIDPYSGQPFAYKADGIEFKLYSVGKNLRDDGGQTNKEFTEPDLMLEE